MLAFDPNYLRRGLAEWKQTALEEHVKAKVYQLTPMPKKFLEKIIQDLIRAGLVKSKRGSTGGYTLARSAEAISFCDVIEAIEGPIAVNACLDHELGCDQMPRCTMIGVWSEVQHSIKEVLSRTTIAALQRTPCHELISSSSLSSAA